MHRLALLALIYSVVVSGLGEVACAEPSDLPPNLAERTRGDDWPTFLGPSRDGKSEETGLDWDWPDEGPPVVWQVSLGQSYSAPSISRGRLFHFDRYGDEDRLICRNAETGEELWTTAASTKYRDMLGYNNGPRATPVVDGNRVYTFGAAGLLQCVEVVGGEVLWEVDTTKEFHVAKNFFGVGSTPVVFGDYLIVHIGGSPPDGPSDIYTAGGRVPASGTGVVAFNKQTGEVVWKAADELASYASPVVATIDDRPWCLMFARGGLVGLDPRNGKVDFNFPWRATKLESVNASTPIVVGNEVFISETYGPGSALLRIEDGKPQVVWQDEGRRRENAMMLHWNTPVYHEGYLYGSSGRHANTAELRCIEWSTGKVQWRQPSLGRCSLLYAEGRLVCLSENGSLLLLNANPQRYDLLQSVLLENASGEQLLEPEAWTAPVLARGLLYVRGDDRLVCLDLTK